MDRAYVRRLRPALFAAGFLPAPCHGAGAAGRWIGAVEPGIVGFAREALDLATARIVEGERDGVRGPLMVDERQRIVAWSSSAQRLRIGRPSLMLTGQVNEQWLLVLKGTLSGGLIVLVNVVAKREPGIAGLIVAFPVITLLSAFWLVIDGVADTTMQAFFSGVLWGLLPTFAFVLGIVVAQRNSVGLGGAIVAGAMAWLLLTTIIQRSGFAH